jgi:hypothetical protein
MFKRITVSGNQMYVLFQTSSISVVFLAWNLKDDMTHRDVISVVTRHFIKLHQTNAMKKLILLALIFSSCAPVYIPNIRNSPMFTKGGEVQISGQIGNGYDGQAAVSITKHLGVMGSYNYINRESADPDNDEKILKHTFAEGGIGYFENKEKNFFEIFAGYGKGEGYSAGGGFVSGTSLYAENATGKYERFFLQPAFGFNKKTVHVSFVPRMSLVDFKEYTVGSTSYKIDEDPKFFFEPAVITRVNAAENHFFFTFQAGFSISINDALYFDYRNFQASTGIGFRLGQLKPSEQ